MARGRLRRGCSLEVILEEDGDMPGHMHRTHSVDSLDSLEYTVSEHNASPLWRIRIDDDRRDADAGGRRARSLDWLICNGDMDVNYSPWDLNGSSYEEELDVDITPDDSTNCSVSPRLEEDSPATRARISRRQIASTWSDRDSPWFMDQASINNGESEDGTDGDVTLSTIQQVKSMFEERVRRNQQKMASCRHGSLERSRSQNSNPVPSVHYLADYDIPDLLLNNNVVIVESRPSSKSGGNQNKPVSVGGFWPPPGINQVFRVTKKSGDGTADGAKTVPRTVGWRPTRLRNKELVDTELPKPDTVKKVRSVFEKTLVFDRKMDGGEDKMTAVKSNPRSKILRSDSFERRGRPVVSKHKFATIHNMISQIKPRHPQQLYVKVVNGDKPKVNKEEPPEVITVAVNPPNGYKAPPPPLSKTSSCPSLVNKPRSRYHKRQTAPPVTKPPRKEESDEEDDIMDEDDMPKYIPREVMERIRACGTSITYFGGQVVSAATKSPLKTLDIVAEIHKGSTTLPIRKNNHNNNQNIRDNLNNILNNYATLPRSEVSTPRIVSVVPKSRSRQVASIRPTGFSDSEDDSSQSPERFSSSPSPAFSSSSSSSPTLRDRPTQDSNHRANMAPKFGQHSVTFNFTGISSSIKPHVPQRNSEEDEYGHVEEAWF